MADLTNADKSIIAEQIIQIIKQNGEYVLEGYRIRFPEILTGLANSNLSSDLKAAKITESGIFGFFREMRNIKVELKAEGTTHWLYLKPNEPLSIDELKSESKLVIDSMKASKGVDSSGQCRISVKELGHELSNRIIFFEYLLRKNNLTAKEFIQQLSKEQTSQMENSSKEKDAKATERMPLSNDSRVSKELYQEAKPENSGTEYTDKDVWDDIVRITQRENKNNPKSKGIVLGVLSTALAAESKAYVWVKSQYKGIVRSFLQEKFGHLLTIDYVDGRDVVVLSDVEYHEKESKKKGASKTKEEGKTSEAISEPSQKVVKQPQIEEELSKLSVDELITLKMIMQVTFNYCGDKIDGAISQLTKKVKSADDTDGLTNAIDNVQLSILATLTRNETMKKALKTNNIDGIINSINLELANRGIIIGDDKRNIPKDIVTVQPVEVSAAEFDGLDDWLPF